MSVKRSKVWKGLVWLAAVVAAGVAWYAMKETDPLSAAQTDRKTATPIEHVVVIFGENVSFDHYFGVYPKAANPAGQPVFSPAVNTPAVNGLTEALLTRNPNFTNTVNGTGATNPFRLDRTQAGTAGQIHSYRPEQQAFNGGAMDQFPRYTGIAGGTRGTGPFYTKGLVMGYFDGNTVTAMWNYAQRFALNDNSFNTTFGPSSPGAINLISGQTNGALFVTGTSTTGMVDDGQGGYTMIGDPQPARDVCSSTSATAVTVSTTAVTVSMQGRNIGDLLNEKGVTWGWFQGGFDLTAVNPDGSTGCRRRSYSPVYKAYKTDYVPHHQPFQYYPSTANPEHKRPRSIASIGTSDDSGANHQYDLEDFFAAVRAGNFPAVSFLKAQSYQDAHPGNSDPLDEQAFVTRVVNFLQRMPDWKSTAVILAYDDSDGWYDHVHNFVNPSFSKVDALHGPNQCGSGSPLPGIKGQPVNGRCGFGPRLPLLVISPYAKSNFVDHTLTDQTSVLRFIEDNWLGGKRIGQGSFDAQAGSIENMFDFTRATNTLLILDPETGLETQPQRQTPPQRQTQPPRQTQPRNP